jgi:hypothetical protein
MSDNNNGWTTTVICILVGLALYLLLDSLPYFKDPLTQTARGVDYVLDESVEFTGNAFTDIARVGGKVVDVIANGTADVVCSVTGLPEKLFIGTANVTGNALIDIGELIKSDKLSAEEKALLISRANAENNEVNELDHLKAAIEAGVVSSPFEGDMIKDISAVSPSEDDPYSSNLDVSINGGTVQVDLDSDPDHESGLGPLNNSSCTQSVNNINIVDKPADIPKLDIGPEFFGNSNDKSDNSNNSNKLVENFYYEYDSPRHCNTCDGKGRFDCNNCENCGYCITADGNGECVAGDANGAYFRDDCVAYEHSANGYRTYRHSPYRYLVGLPYWRKDGYYNDLRGYPRTKFIRRTGSQRRGRRLARQRNSRSGSRSGSRSSHRSNSRNRDVVSPTGRSRSRSAYIRGRSSSPRSRAGSVRVGTGTGMMGRRVGGGSRMGGGRSGGGRSGGSRMGGRRSGGGRRR